MCSSRKYPLPPNGRDLPYDPCEAGRCASHARQGSEACEAYEAEIPNPNKKANRKLPKLTVCANRCAV